MKLKLKPLKTQLYQQVEQNTYDYIWARIYKEKANMYAYSKLRIAIRRETHDTRSQVFRRIMESNTNNETHI